MKKILGIGNALVDVMTIINDDAVLTKFSLPKGSMQLVETEISQIIKSGTDNYKKSLASGGSAANTIHGLAMLGINTGFIGSIGRDELGDFFENDLKKAAINTFLFRRKTATGTAVALITPDSERTFATHLGAAVELNAEDLKKEYFKGYDMLYLEGYLIYNKPLVITACELAKENGMKIALDLASYNIVEAYHSDFQEILEKYVDLVFANEEEARAYTGKEPYEALEELAKECEIAIVKTGGQGSLIRRGDEILKIGVSKINPVDTTGAGDLYASGFLYGYSKGENLEVCGQYGSLLAGSVIEILGARIPENIWPEIKRLLEKMD